MRLRIAACALVALLGIVRAAEAHAVHTTLTVVTVASDHRSLTLSIRVFADDFSLAVARAAGKPAPRDSSAVAKDIDQYVLSRFTIDGATLASCGVERTADTYVLCFRAVLTGGASTVRVRNLMLSELHEDQVNIVQSSGGHARETHLFTKRSAPAEIVLR
jgi:hypothetical protein